jgi:hypothetical protein
MTTANMKLVVLNVNLDDKMETPEQKLEAGEFIVKRVVELSKLNDELKGWSQILASRLAHCISHSVRRKGWLFILLVALDLLMLHRDLWWMPGSPTGRLGTNWRGASPKGNLLNPADSPSRVYNNSSE